MNVIRRLQICGFYLSTDDNIIQNINKYRLYTEIQIHISIRLQAQGISKKHLISDQGVLYAKAIISPEG